MWNKEEAEAMNCVCFFCAVSTGSNIFSDEEVEKRETAVKMRQYLQ